MTRNVTLKRVKRARRSKRPRFVWMLRWHDSHGKQLGETLGDCSTMTKRQAEAIRRDRQGRFDHSIETPDRPDRMTLSVFADQYAERRRAGDAGKGLLRGSPRLAEATIIEHSMALRYMLQHFGDDRMIDSIGVADADEFLTALAAGRLSAARKRMKRDYGPMSEQRVRALVRSSKAVFNWAKRFGMVRDNPFSAFDGAPLPTDANAYVPIEDFRKLLEVAPSHGWRTLYSLCRLAGLRRGEALALPWSGRTRDSFGREHTVGVDWDRRRLLVMGCHKGSKPYRFREVPICPDLYDVLLAAFDAAADGQVTVCGLNENNLTRHGQAHIKAAGMTPWPKTFQALRSSCENDWKVNGTAEATYAAWSGHGETVSRKHYTSPTDIEFAAISRAHLGHTSESKPRS